MHPKPKTTRGTEALDLNVAFRQKRPQKIQHSFLLQNPLNGGPGGFRSGAIPCPAPRPRACAKLHRRQGVTDDPLLTPETVGDLLRFAVVEHGGDVQAGAVGTSMHVPL